MIAIVGAALFYLLNPAPSAAPWIGDPFQHFTRVQSEGPHVSDLVATECDFDDRACIVEHDRRVASLAATEQDPNICSESTRPGACVRGVASAIMIAGDVELPGNPVLDDPCAWVVRVDKEVATLYSRRLMLTRRAANHGWHAGQFIGACDVSTVGPVTDGPLVETKLVDFPWGSR